MAKVLVVYAGGTVGMLSSSNGYKPDKNFAEVLASLLANQVEEEFPRCDVVSMTRLIDSANVQVSDWKLLGELLINNWDEYDAFVVLHGTDTMAYTASALSFMLRGIDKPVILTGSQIPLSQVRSDGANNIVGAVLLAANRAAAEVCIYFGGKLLRGNRSTKVHTTDLAAFDSPNCDPLATLNIYMSANRHMALSPLVRAFSLPDYDPNHVVVLSLFPGIQASMLAAIVENTNPTGIVLESYGVGNVPDEDAALMALIERESNAGRIFINRTQCSKGRVYQGAYATGAVLNSMGVVSAGDMTREAAFTKLHHLIASGLSASEVRNKMGTSLCGELTE